MTAAPVNDIKFCNEERCAGDCGPALDLCEQGLTGNDAAAGATPDVMYTTDSGATWTNAATAPFAVDENVISLTCVRKDVDTTRWIVVRDLVALTNAEIAYSDDSGATWTNVDVESSGTGLGANDSGASWALDFKHIWLVLTGGYIVFSSNGGATWTVQQDGTGVTSEDFNAVHFADFDHGYAVADTGVVVKTDDGGETWEAVTAIDSTPDVLSVWTFDEDNVMVGDADGQIWRSWDAGTTWTELYDGDSINDIHFVNDYVGWAIDDDEVLRTRNGGEDWETVSSVPAATEYNAVWGCDENLCYVCGEDSSNNGVVLKIS